VKFWRNREIEERTSARLAEYHRMTGWEIEPPVPVELLAERLFDLRLLYEPFVDAPGFFVPAAFEPATRTIVVNENHRAAFDDKPGLERFSVGHEVGHWDLFESNADKSSGSLFGDTATGTRMNCRTVGNIEARFIPGIWRDDGSYEVLSYLERVTDSPTVASAVNRYAGALLMPRNLLREFFDFYDITSWTCLRAVAESFGVSISALKVRLEKLGWVCVAADGSLVKCSREEYAGQQRISF